MAATLLPLLTRAHKALCRFGHHAVAQRHSELEALLHWRGLDRRLPDRSVLPAHRAHLRGPVIGSRFLAVVTLCQGGLLALQRGNLGLQVIDGPLQVRNEAALILPRKARGCQRPAVCLSVRGREKETKQSLDNIVL